MLFSKYVSYFMPIETYEYMTALKSSDKYMSMETHEMLNIIFQREFELVNLRNSSKISSSETSNSEQAEVSNLPTTVSDRERDIPLPPPISPQPLTPPPIPIASVACSMCGENFTSDSELSEHTKATHSKPDGQYKCWCGASFEKVPLFIQHNYKCLNLKPRIKLEPIDARPANSINITAEVHQFKASGPTHRCQNCGRKFRTSSSLFVHNCRAIAHRSTNRGCENTPVVQPVSEQPLELVCSQRSEKNVQPSNFQLICHCSRRFDDYQQYRDHSSECGQPRTAQLSVPNLGHRSSPLKVLPNENGKFQCTKCSKSFSSILSLRQHYDGTHREVPKYSCPYCHKRYKWCTSFNYHKRNCSVRSVNDL